LKAPLEGRRLRLLDGRGLGLGGIRIDEWGGKEYRVFFLRKAESRCCYCFSQSVAEG
jgi:hypothetical protein